jgi:hypothetical protein
MQEFLFPVALAVIAAAYAAVGQAGATGYIAAMGLAGYTPDIIRPAALGMNTLVAAIGTVRFAQAGFSTWRGTYPFILLGLPLSVVGGATHIPASVYYPLVGLLLLVAAWQMFRTAQPVAGSDIRCPAHPPLAPSILAGAIIGFIAGRYLHCASCARAWLAEYAADCGSVSTLQSPELRCRPRGAMEHISGLSAGITVVAGRRCHGCHIRRLVRHKTSGAQSLALSSCNALADRRIVDVVGLIKSGPVAFRKHAPGLTDRGVSALRAAG